MSVLAALTSTYLARAAHQTERRVRRVTGLRGAAASAHAPTAAESHDTGPGVALPHPEPTETSLSPTTDPASSPASGDNEQGWPWRAIAIFAGAVFAVTIIVVLAVGIATGADQPIAPAAPARTPAPAVTSRTSHRPPRRTPTRRPARR
jgi:hypothetical protein